MSREHATWIPLCLRGPTLLRHLRDFADRRIHDSKSLAAGNPECRIPDAPDSCHLSLQELRSRSNRGIALRGFDVHAILALANPDLPICDGQGFFCCLRANCPAPSPGSDGHRTSRNPARRFKSLIFFLYEEAFTRHLRSGRSSLVRTLVETRGTLPPEHFSTQTPSEISQRHALCSIFNHFPKVMKSSESCALTLATASTSSSSDLLLRLNSTCTHLHGSNTLSSL
jgi:hypothetical protein